MSDTTTTPITPAVAGDVPTIGEALARAFHDDPVLAWIVEDPAARRARLPSLFAAFAEAYLSHRETYLVGEGLGAALWAPPGRAPVPEDRAEAFGQRLAEVLGEDLDRAMQLQGLLEEHHPQRPCFYLQFLGVVPDHQGQGLGSRLLTTVLERADATGTPAYLEATSPQNRRLYQRHGFDVVAEATLPRGPSLWPMWREPASSPDGATATRGSADAPGSSGRDAYRG